MAFYNVQVVVDWGSLMVESRTAFLLKSHSGYLNAWVYCGREKFLSFVLVL